MQEVTPVMGPQNPWANFGSIGFCHPIYQFIYKLLRRALVVKIITFLRLAHSLPVNRQNLFPSTLSRPTLLIPHQVLLLCPDGTGSFEICTPIEFHWLWHLVKLRERCSNEVHVGQSLSWVEIVARGNYWILLLHSVYIALPTCSCLTASWKPSSSRGRARKQ